MRARVRFPWMRSEPLLILLAAAGLALPSIGPAQQSTPQSPPENAPTPRQRTTEQVVGGKCLQCHRKVVEEFVNEVHGKSAHFMAGGSEATCETCHGDGTKHNDTTLAADIANPPRMKPAEADKTCLACHSRDHNRTFFAASAHDRKGMSCLSCHSTHHFKSVGKELIQPTEGELCTSCHTEIRKAYFQRSTHLFRTENHDEKIACATCHNPHGSEAPKLIAAVSTNALCYTCHAELRGPFLWEHPPVRENCQNCHLAHGSNNPTLLKTRLHMLCQQCHMHMLNRHQTVAGFDVFTFNRGCANCHNQVHGSNHPSGKTFTH